jgi:hypothetical protein
MYHRPRDARYVFDNCCYSSRYWPNTGGCHLSCDEYGYRRVGHPGNSRVNITLTRLGSPPCACWQAVTDRLAFMPRFRSGAFIEQALRLRRRFSVLDLNIDTVPCDPDDLDATTEVLADILYDRGRSIGYEVGTTGGKFFFRCRGRNELLWCRLDNAAFNFELTTWFEDPLRRSVLAVFCDSLSRVAIALDAIALWHLLKDFRTAVA